MKNIFAWVLILLSIICSKLLAMEEVVQNYPVPRVVTTLPSLGSAYFSLKNSFGSEVIGGETSYIGTQTAEWRNEVDMASSKKAYLISGSANIEINYNVFSGFGGMSLDLVKKSTSHSYSETLWFDVLGKTKKITIPRVGQNFSNLPKTAAISVFGDKFVDSVTVGGRLILDIQIEFDENIDSTKVTGNVKIEIAKLIKGEASASVELDERMSSSKIKIFAKQIGGDGSKLSAIFGNGDHVIECAGGQYDRCSDIVRQIFIYSQEFGKQLKEMKYDPNDHAGAGVLAFTTSSYESAGLDIFRSNHPIQEHFTAVLQQEMTNEYFSLIEDVKYVDFRLRRAVGEEKTRLNKARASIMTNLILLVNNINASNYDSDKTRHFSDTYKNQKADFEDVTQIPSNTEGPFSIVHSIAFEPKCLAAVNQGSNTRAKISDYIIKARDFVDNLESRFTLKDLEDGSYAIFTLDGHVLEAEAKRNGSWVKTHPFNERSSTQRWQFTNKEGIGTIRLKDSNLALAIDAKESRLKVLDNRGDFFILGGGDEFIREEVLGQFTISGVKIGSSAMFLESGSGQDSRFLRGAEYRGSNEQKFAAIKCNDHEYYLVTKDNLLFSALEFRDGAKVENKRFDINDGGQRWSLRIEPTTGPTTICITNNSNELFLKVPELNNFVSVCKEKHNRFRLGKKDEYANEFNFNY